MALFANKQASNLRSCIQMVDDVIKALGHDPGASRADTQGPTPSWCVRKGSVLVYVTLTSQGDLGENQLQVIAPVLHLDATTDRPGLFQHLLELNATAIKGAAFALRGDEIVLVAERSTLDLDLSGVREIIAKVETYADDYDDRLVNAFGGSLPSAAR